MRAGRGQHKIKTVRDFLDAVFNGYACHEALHYAGLLDREPGHEVWRYALVCGTVGPTARKT